MSSEPSTSELMTRLDEIRNDVRDVKHRLFGNGQPGLIRTVDRHDEWIKATKWLLVTVIGTAVTLIVGGTATAAIWIIRTSGN